MQTTKVPSYIKVIKHIVNNVVEGDDPYGQDVTSKELKYLKEFNFESGALYKVEYWGEIDIEKVDDLTFDDLEDEYKRQWGGVDYYYNIDDDYDETFFYIQCK